MIGTGITLAQLYSTASYQTHDLTGISLNFNNLGGGNFTGHNLSNASFYSATLRDADFRQANLAKSTFNGATLTGADFTNADVRGARFEQATYYGFTASQLYATASYQSHDLTGIRFGDSYLSGWNFAGQNLTNSSFARISVHLAMGLCLSSDLVIPVEDEAPRSRTLILTGADFTSADTRGSILDLSGATTTNLI